MVLPLIPIAAAGVLGGVTGGLLGKLLGGDSKKEQAVSAIETHAPYETYQPTTTTAYAPVYAPSPVYQIESPYSTITKKDVAAAEATAKGQPMFYQPTAAPTAEAGIAEGLDLTKLAIIGVIGLVTYGVVTK